MRLLSVAYGVAWRMLHTFFTNPSLLLPALLFPLFFFTAFAGGLSGIQHVPGFDFAPGYTAFQFVFVVLGLAQATVYLGVGLAIGVDFRAGVPGVLLLYLFAFVVSLGFGALGAFVALRTGTGEAVQSLFPLFFVFLFISSMAIPRNLIGVTWFRDVATVNPVSYLIELVRSLIVIGWDGEALALGFGIGTVLTVVALALSSWALRERMART